MPQINDSIGSMKKYKGPFIFYEVGGAGGIWGAPPKKNGLEGGVSYKKMRE